MVILRNQNKITDFLMILAWASPFNMFKYLFYESLTFRNILILSVPGLFYTSESDVCRRQILTYRDDPRAERVNYLGMLAVCINFATQLILACNHFHIYI